MEIAQKIRSPSINIAELQFEIVKDTPLPSLKYKKKEYRVFEEMAVGDHIEIDTKELYAKVYAASGNYGRKNNKVFAGRSLENGKFGIWRVK